MRNVVLEKEVSGVHNHVMQILSIDLSVNQVYSSKRKTKDFINGDEQLQYGVLRDYAQMINTIDKFGRQILSTTTKDANDNIFLVAMAIVEQENKES